MKSTGSPEDFAEKLGIRRSTLFESLQEMREMGVNIKYSFLRQSYYYADGRRIKVILEDDSFGINNDEPDFEDIELKN